MGRQTLTAFTAAAVGKALDLLPHRPKKLVVSGGGRHNPAMMAMLVSRADVEPCKPKRSGGKATPWRRSALPSWRCACCAACRSVFRARPARRNRCAAAGSPLEPVPSR